MKSRSAASDAAIRTTPTYPRSTNRFPSGEQKECIMARQTVLDPRLARIPGTGTRAKAQYQQTQRRLDALAARRQEQINVAKTYVCFAKGRAPLSVDKLPEDSVERQVFLASVEAFARAEQVKDGDKVIKRAIEVALDTAADSLKALFEDSATVDAALRGSEWAEKALRWAGHKLFSKKPAEVSA